MKKTLVLSCMLALAGLSNVALAAEGQGYARVELGNASIDVKGGRSDDDTAYSLRGGYWFTNNLAVEGFYSNLYDQSKYGTSLELDGYGAGIVAKENFGANDSGFFLQARVGVARMKGKLSNAFGRYDDTSTKAYVGVGVGYDFSEAVGVSLNYDYHKADFDRISVDADVVTLGGEFRF